MNRMIELYIQVHTGSRLSSIYFKDYYEFINLPLHLLPKLFGFHNDLQKGFFSHLLNTKENMNYESAELPDIKFFDVDGMNEEDRSCCKRWHREGSSRMKSQDGLYNLCSEMLKYCYDDCFMLSTAFTHFNEFMICELKQSGVTGIIDHEFTILGDFITLPQMVIHWFIGSMMPECCLAFLLLLISITRL